MTFPTRTNEMRGGAGVRQRVTLVALGSLLLACGSQAAESSVDGGPAPGTGSDSGFSQLPMTAIGPEADGGLEEDSGGEGSSASEDASGGDSAPSSGVGSDSGGPDGGSKNDSGPKNGSDAATTGHEGGSGGALPSLGTIGFHAYLIDSSVTGDMATIASRSEFITIQRWRTDLLSQIRAANPKTKVLLYANFTGMVYPDSSGNYSGGVDPTNAPESWFLHNTSGQRFTFDNYPSIWAANQGNSGYRQQWAQSTAAVAKKAGFDGVFADDCNATIVDHYTPADVEEYPTDQAYGTATLGALQTIGPEEDAAGFLLIPNMNGTWGQYASWANQFVAVNGVSGGLDEFFTLWPGDDAQPLSIIQAAMQSQANAESLGKYYLADVQTSTTTASADIKAALFGLATAMLNANGHVSFFWNDSYGDQPWLSQFDTARALGAPEGASYASGSVTRRDFAKGYVTVDFSSLTGTVVENP